MADGTVPVLNGVTLWRPVEYEEPDEFAGGTVELASGATRAFLRGVRGVWSIRWQHRTRAQVNALRGAVAGGAAVPFTALDGVTYLVLPGPVGVVAIAGTEPVRYDVTLRLTEQTPR